MAIPLQVLIVEDSEDDTQLILREIRRGGYDVKWERVQSRTAMKDALARQSWDVVISDHNLPQFNSLNALEILHESGQDLPFIIASGSIGEEAAINILTAGAHDFVVKDKMARLVPAIQRELKDAEVRRQRRQAEEVIHRDLAEFQMLYESGLALNQLMNPKKIAQKLIDIMSKKLDWHHTAIRLYRQEDESLELLAFNLPNAIYETELRAMEERLTSMIVKIGDGLTGWAANHHQLVRVGDLSQDARYREVIPGLHSGLYVPMQMGERLVGIISVESEKLNAFREADERLVVTLANQAAIALENGRSFENAQRRLHRTQALREVDQAIAGSMNLNLVLEIVLKHAVKELEVDTTAILLYDPVEQILKYELGRGFRTTALQHTRLHLGDGYAGRAVLSRQIIYVSDLQTRKTDFLRSPTFHQEGFVCYFAVPLIAKGEIRGVMEIFHRTALNPAKEWLDFMETLAGQIAIAIDNATLFKNLQQSNIQLAMAYDATIEGWSKALDLRDKETEGHTQRVTELAMRLARSMGVGEAEIFQIQRGGLLHDIGKMGVPDGILLKPGALTEEEWVVMKKHPVFAYEMLAPIQYLQHALDIPYCHHEKWDGTGYPRGLKGEEIPLAARIFAVVDVYDALTSDRPYRPAWTKENALKHIRQGAGSHFETQVVEKFISMIANDR
ncbi:MAG: HD domain-containing phosphohydrolase [Anaerolineales bacterium]